MYSSAIGGDTAGGTTADFDISTGSSGTVATIAVSGELDIATAPRLEATVSHDGLGAAETVVLDLGGVTFIDSTGLRAVLLLHAEVGPRLRIVPSDACRRVMAIAGVTGSLPLENGDEPA